MIRLSRKELLEMARVYVLANTPRSLYEGLLGCAAVEKMRQMETPEALQEYFRRITARPGRSELVLGLAYGVLISILLNRRGLGPRRLDASRLQWGENVQSIANSLDSPTHFLEIAKTYRPTIKATNQPSSDLIVLPGVRPRTWENKP